MAAILDIDTSKDANPPQHLRIVAEALERLRYGVFQLSVQDRKLMQVDVMERRRFA